MDKTLNDNMAFGFGFGNYRISDQATNSGVATTRYFGYVAPDGSWYIMEDNSSAGANSLRTFRYSKGDGITVSYATAWAGREALTYGVFNTVFK